MASLPKNVLVFGGTGIIGKYLVDELLKANKFNITLFTSADTVKNKADHIASLKERGSKIVTGNVRDEQDVRAAYQGIH
jgi:nucleoside-diphosphate-sugar epimerase